MTEKVLKACRVVERRTDAGPLLYMVQALWYPSPGWITHTTTHDHREAAKALHGLVEGLDGSTGERITMSWTNSGYHMDHLAAIEADE